MSKTAKELIEVYGCARSTKGTAESYVRLIVNGEDIPPKLATIAAAVGAAGYRSTYSMTDTPRTSAVERWYRAALHAKANKHTTRKESNDY